MLQIEKQEHIIHAAMAKLDDPAWRERMVRWAYKLNSQEVSSDHPREAYTELWWLAKRLGTAYEGP